MMRDWETVHDFHGDLRTATVATWWTPTADVEESDATWAQRLADLRPKWVVDYRADPGVKQ
jgi:hypothetical protein